jgi:hypothetical protein
VQEIPLAAFGENDDGSVNGLFKKDDVLYVLSSNASLLTVNLSTSAVKTITMPYGQMEFTGYDVAYNDALFMYEQDHEDNTKVLRYDIATEKFDELTVDGSITTALLQDGVLYVTTQEKTTLYDANTLELMSSFELEAPKKDLHRIAFFHVDSVK